MLPLFSNPADHLLGEVISTSCQSSTRILLEQISVLGEIVNIVMAGLLKKPFKLALVQLAAGKW
jgi:hypothetical protein